MLTLLAVWLRFRLLGYTEIIHDQARTLNMALQWVHGGPLPLTSDLTSLGVHNPPLIIYLYALALAFQPSIWSVTYLLGALSLLGIAFYGWAISRVLGWRASGWACGLFVVAPWAVYYGRYIWQASFVPVFATGLFACTVLYLTRDPHPRWLVVGALFFSGTFQMHVVSITLLPVLVGLGLTLRPRQLAAQWRWLVAATGLAALSLAPYIVFQIQTRFADWTLVQGAASGPLDINLTALELALDLFRSRSIFDMAGQAADHWRAASPAWQLSDTLCGLWFGLAVVGAGALSRVLPRQTIGQRPAVWLISVLWFGVPILPFVPHTRWVINHYFLHLMPAGFTLLALASDTLCLWLQERVRQTHYPRLGFLIAQAAFLPVGLILAQQLIADIVGQDIMAQGLAGKQRAVDTQIAIDKARQLTAEHPECQWVVVNEVPLWEDSRFGLMREFVGADRVRFVQDGGTQLWPTPCAVYFVVSQSPEADTRLGSVAEPLPEATIQTPEEIWRFYYLADAARQEVVSRLQREAPEAIWENDVELYHHAVHEALLGECLQLDYVWVIGQRYVPPPGPTATSLRFGNYLLSSDGQLISQIDGVTTDSREWRAGDVIERQWCLSVPVGTAPDTWHVATAIYSLPEVQRIPLHDPPGDLLILDGGDSALP